MDVQYIAESQDRRTICQDSHKFFSTYLKLALTTMPQAQFEILPGLPGYGPLPEQFSATGQGKYREGYVVKFMSEGAEEWVGNFQPGLTRFSGVFQHPDQVNVVVVAGGAAYVVDPNKRQLMENFGGSIESVFELKNNGLLILGNGLSFAALASDGILWQAKRLSWDGMRNVAIINDKIIGEGWMFDDTWHSFEVNLTTGESEGGAYEEPES
jgi:hypothetical protein